MQQPRGEWAIELTAKAADLDVNHIRERRVSRSLMPNVARKHLAGGDTTLLFREINEQVEFPSCQFQSELATGRSARFQLKAQVAYLKHCELQRGSHTRATAQQRADSREQFGKCEGLAQVVVCARFQSEHALSYFVMRGEQQYRYPLTFLTKLRQQFESAAPRQSDVQDQEIGAPGVQREVCVFGRARCIHRKARSCHGASYAAGELCFVIDHEDVLLIWNGSGLRTLSVPQKRLVMQQRAEMSGTCQKNDSRFDGEMGAVPEHIWTGGFTMIFLAGLLLQATLSTAAVALPAQTTLPVVFTRTVSATTAHIGDAVEARTVAPVRLAGGEVLPKGARVLGHVVAARSFRFDPTPYARQTPSALAIRFDTVQSAGVQISLHVEVRALADPITSRDTLDPLPTDIDPTHSTTQVGGDEVTPFVKEISSAEGDTVGYLHGGYAYAHLIANGDCDASDTEQAMGIFSASACGLYGMSGDALTTETRGHGAVVVLSSARHSPEIYKNSHALLEELPE